MSQTQSRIGATVEEWRWAAYQCGADLLTAYLGSPTTPSTPRMQGFLPESTGKAVVYPWAKVPSRLNRDGVVEGFGKWTSFTATPHDVEQWSLDPDNNILLQTRNVRAIDIDIESTPAADALEHMVCATLGVKLPVRFRSNSGKRTLLLRLDPTEYISKKVIHTEVGAIEFLANGNQTVLFGRHPSGARFEHRNLEQGIPTVPLAAMSALWDTLRTAYDPLSKPLTIEGEKQGEYLTRNATQLKPDPVLDYLESEGWVTGYVNNGNVSIRCPNVGTGSNNHPPGEASSTVWLPAGLGGREVGGFRCLHSHCRDRHTKQFLEEIGYRDKEIATAFGGASLQPHPVSVAKASVLAATQAAPLAKGLTDKASLELLQTTGAQLLPSLEIDSVKGRPTKTLHNLVSLLQSGDSFIAVQHDDFKAVAQVRLAGQTDFKVLTDGVVGTVRLAAERVLGHTYGHDEVSRHLSLIAEYNRYDSAQCWLSQQTWDGVPRIGLFARDILKAVPSDYATALGEYLFVAFAGRVLVPGCKADIAPVLLSPHQGTGKSSLVEALAPFHDWFGQVDLTKEDDDVYRALRGKVVIELPELRGLMGRDAQATKALLTQQVDRWVPKYREFEVEVPRRSVFVGTDNRYRFLSDPTGNRRWAPIQVARTAKYIDWPTFEKERAQYWAEARVLCADNAAQTVETYSTRLRKLAGPAIADATILDAWHSAVAGFVAQQPIGGTLTLTAIFSHLFGAGLSAMDYTRVARLRNIMVVLKAQELGPDLWQVPEPEFVL